MSRRAVTLLTVATVGLVLGSAHSLRAELCAVDPVPAATLLLPYFEVDLGAGAPGATTVFTLHNDAATATLAHVTLWTDWAFPTLDFDIFLTGYDAVSVDLFQILGLGNLPVTADQQSDPNDTISPHGGNPAWDDTIASCAGFFPFTNPILNTALLDRVQNSHSGYPVASLGDSCTGSALNGAATCSGGTCPAGTVARGYITVDVTDQCSVLFPNDSGYFVDGGAGVASNQNRLWGDFELADSTGNRSVGGRLVGIEADDNFDGSSTPSNYTFYGRYTQAAGGSDNREPLASVANTRFSLSAGRQTELLVWRDPTVNQTDNNAGWTCGLGTGAGPDWYPLDESEVTCFDELRNPLQMCRPNGPSPPALDPTCFPGATQRLALGAGDLDPGFQNGWCRLNLNIPADAPTDDVDFPVATSGPISQSVVFAVVSDAARSAGRGASIVAHACSDTNPLVCTGADTDADLIADVCDPDDDGDTVDDVGDDDPLDAFVCRDLDSDTCDDCSALGVADPANDGPDMDGDGACDAGDPCPADPSCLPVVLQSFEVSDLPQEPAHAASSPLVH